MIAAASINVHRRTSSHQPPAQSRLTEAHFFAARESVLHADFVSPICLRWNQPARPGPSALPPQPHRIAGNRTGSRPAHALPEAAGPHRLRLRRRRNHQLQRLRHRAARRRQHPQHPPHLPQQHRRRTLHPALHRQAPARLRVQLRQLPLHPELHLHPPAHPKPSPQRADRRPRDHPRLRRPPRSFYGVQPYLGAGGGTIRFNPTPNGGEGLPFQYRAVYYYNFGVEDNFTGRTTSASASASASSSISRPTSSRTTSPSPAARAPASPPSASSSASSFLAQWSRQKETPP